MLAISTHTLSMPGSTRLPLATNFVWSLVGTVGQAAAQWGVIAVLARLGNATVVGAYALALAIAAPVFLFASLHLRALQSTDMDEEFSFTAYFSLRAVTTLLAGTMLLVVACYLGGLTGWALAGLVVAKGFEAVSDAMYGRLQREERMDQIGQSMLYRAGGAFLAMVAAMTTGMGMAVGVWAGAAVAGVVALCDFRRVPDVCLSIRPPMRQVLRLAAKAAPLGLLLLLISLNANIPRYFLAGEHSVRDVGILAALGYVAGAANTIVMAMGQAAVPSLARAFARRAVRAFVESAAPLILVSVTLGIAGAAASFLAGQSLLRVLYGPEFAAEGKAFFWLMLGGAMGYLAAACGYLLSSARCFQPQLPIMAAALGVTVVGCYLFVPEGGLLSAAKAQAAGFAAQFLLSAAVLVSCCWQHFRRNA